MNLQGVLLMSLGSPDKLEDMEAYLLDIRQGRPVRPEFVEELKERYRQAGGYSPLLEITKLQAAALESKLNSSEKKFKSYVGMRHWHPYIEEAMKEILRDGVTKLVSLPLTPYYSRLSTEAYHEKVREAKEKLGAKLDVIFVESWNVDPLLVEAYAELIEKGASKFANRNNLKILFTAHSLPERILDEGDPYQDELIETINLVAEKAKLKEWDFAYQSQGGTNEPWLGPKVEDMLEKYGQQQIEKVLLVPVGFVSDHIEILYDIDVLFKKIARGKKIHLERTPSPNDYPKFIEALESVVLKSLAASGEKAAAT